MTGVDTVERNATVLLANGREQTLSLDAPRDQHIRHAYVETAFAAQGRTADHVMIHADSKATNLVDQKTLYVAVSQARTSAAIFTDDRAKLVSGMRERAGVAQAALDVASREQVSVKASGIGLS